MANLKEKIASRLNDIIGNRPIIDLGNKAGPSRSYIYRIKKGQNVSVEQLDALLRAYGSNLGEFFAPWRGDAVTERLKQAAELRELIEVLIASDVDLAGLCDICRLYVGRLSPPPPSDDASRMIRRPARRRK